MSASKRVIYDHHLIQNGDMDGSITSEVLDAGSIDHVALEIIWAGASPDGSVALQGSVTGVNWSPIGTATTIASNSGNAFQVTAAVIPFSKLRVVYTRASGDGTLNVHLSAKSN